MEPTEPVEVSEKSISELHSAMARTGFQGRKLGETFETWLEMLNKDGITILMGLSGAMVPAGMRRVIAWLIRNRYYAIQITTDTPQFGGLSGCTLEEGVSWGKIAHRGEKVQVNVDTTIALPLLAHALIGTKRRRYPVFTSKGIGTEYGEKYEVSTR